MILFFLAIVAGAVLYTPDASRTVLEARYLNSPADMIEIANTSLHVRDTGPRDGHAVILLHGIGSHLQTWDGWADALDDDYRTIRFDMPGAGLSPPDASADYTDTRAILLVNALMDELEVETASLIGNSLGGRIAWTFAAANPDRVDKLVLVSPDGFASPGFAYGKPGTVPRIMVALKYALPKSMVQSALEIAYADPAKISDQTLQRYHDLLRAPGARAAMFARMGQTVLTEPEPLLARIEASVLLIWGEDDAIIPVSNAADYQAALQHETLLVLPGIGHLPQEEAPTQTVVPILEFLEAELVTPE